MVGLLLTLLACDVLKTSDSGSMDTGAPGDDTSGGTDTADTYSGDTSLEPLPDRFCDLALPTAPADGPECREAEVLQCGDVVEATLEGGRSVYTADDWEGWYCSVNLDRHPYDGPERAWRLDIPARTTAYVRIDTPCANLDVFAIFWEDPDSCPLPGAGLRVCETGDGDGSVDVAEVHSVDAESDLIIVDAKDGEVANFRLSVTCN